MFVTFNLKNQVIQRTDRNVVAAGSKNYLFAKFNLLTDDWNGTITAVFNDKKQVLNEERVCEVPWEVLQNPGIVKVSAFCGYLLTSTIATIEVVPSGGTDGTVTEPPTPDVYAQITSLAQNAVDTANSVQQRADAGEFNGRDAPQIDDTQASPRNPWSGYKVDNEIKAVYNALEKSNIQFPVMYSGTSIHADNTLAENLTLNRNKVEILGQTIQNCLDHSSVDTFLRLDGTIDQEGYINITATGSNKFYVSKKESSVLKVNTLYTFVIDVAENTLQSNNAGALFEFGESYAEEPSCFTSVKYLPNLPLGLTKFTLQTKEDFTGVDRVSRNTIVNKAISGAIKFRYAIIEGDWTNRDVSWVPFGLNTPQATEVVMENGDATERSTVTIDKPLGSVSDTIRDRVYLKDGKAYHEQNVEEQDGVMVALESPVTTEISIADFYSYAGQTNWYTTNAVKPTIKAEIPSNLSAVVGSVAVENAILKQENQSMYQVVTGRMAALEETIPVMAEAANNLAEMDSAYLEGVNSI